MEVWKIDSANLISAWADACDAICGGASNGDIVVASAPPMPQAPNWLSRIAVVHGTESPLSVAKVLCPSVVLMPHPTRDAALASGLDLFGRGRRRGL